MNIAYGNCIGFMSAVGRGIGRSFEQVLCFDFGLVHSSELEGIALRV